MSAYIVINSNILYRPFSRLATYLIYRKKEFTIKFAIFKLVKLPIFNVLSLKLAKKLIFKSRQFYKEMLVGGHYMPFKARYHAYHIHFLAKIPQKYLA